MKNTICASIVRLALCCLMVGVGIDQTAGKSSIVISGYVVDTAGAAVPDATVNVVDLRGSFDHPVPSVQTTKEGFFHAVVCCTGAYRLLAWKQSAGVPNPVMSIYESPDANYPLIKVATDQPVHDLMLTLPKPFGRLTGRVVDQDKNVEISTARVTLTCTEDHAVYLSKGIGKEGELNLLLPPKPIDVVISAPGYRAWSLRSHLPSQTPLVLRSGEVKELVIRLQPDK